MPSALPDIPFEKFVLDNGLTLIVHEEGEAIVKDKLFEGEVRKLCASSGLTSLTQRRVRSTSATSIRFFTHGKGSISPCEPLITQTKENV